MKKKVHKEKRTQKTGRPTIPIDMKVVDSLLEAGCTGEEVAAYVGVHSDTLFRHICKEKNVDCFTDYSRLYKKPKIKEKKEVNHKHKYQINTWDKRGYYIYVIQHGNTNYYKIGVSKLKIKDRLQCLQVGNPIKLKCIQINYTNNASKIETQIHLLFKNKNINGEWFMLSNKELNIIKSKIQELDLKLNQLKLF